MCVCRAFIASSLCLFICLFISKKYILLQHNDGCASPGQVMHLDLRRHRGADPMVLSELLLIIEGYMIFLKTGDVVLC